MRTAPPTSPPTTPRKPGSALVRYSGTLHLLGLPELKLFPDKASRLIALDEIAHGKIGGVAGFLTRPWILMLLSAIATIAVVSLRPSSAFFHLSATNAVYLDSGLLCLFIFILFVPLHRPFAARHLRRRLLDAGVPVCVKCGYDLRGLDVPQCPECGSVVPPQALALMEEKVKSEK